MEMLLRPAALVPQHCFIFVGVEKKLNFFDIDVKILYQA
jgi:hypothetical protein